MHRRLNVIGRRISSHPITISGISGCVAGLVFSFGLPAYFLILALIPFFYYFDARERLSATKSIVIILSFFIPFYAVVLSWFVDSDTSGLVGLSREMSLFASGISLLIMTVVLTIVHIPFALGMHRIQRLLRQSPVYASILISSMWVVSEWAASLAFSIFLYGSGGSIGDYWNFGSFGLAIMDTPLSYASRIVGMYGLSFLTVMTAGAIYVSFTRKRYTFLITLVASLVSLVILGSYLFGSGTGSTLQGSVLQIKSTDSDYTLGAPVENYSKEQKDVIVLPEYSKVFEHGHELFAEQYVSKRLKTDGISIDVTEGSKDKWYGTLEFRDSTGKLIKEQTKELLIPTGEYLPAVLTTFYNNTGQSELVQHFDKSRRVEKGSPPEVFSSDDLTVGPVACSGILARNIYRQHTSNGAMVLTNSASLAYFNGSKSYYRQAMLMARFHAIANSRPFIQATLGAPAFVLDANGSYIVEPTDSRTTFIDFDFQSSKNKTPYTKTGEWVLLFSGFVMLAGLGWQLIHKIVSRKA